MKCKTIAHWETQCVMDHGDTLWHMPLLRHCFWLFQSYWPETIVVCVRLSEQYMSPNRQCALPSPAVTRDWFLPVNLVAVGHA